MIRPIITVLVIALASIFTSCNNPVIFLPPLFENDESINQKAAETISANLDLVQLIKDSLKKKAVDGIETTWTKLSTRALGSEYSAVSRFTGGYTNNDITIISGAISYSFSTSRDGTKVYLEFFEATTIEPLVLSIEGATIENVSLQFNGAFTNTKITEKTDGSMSSVSTIKVGINLGASTTVDQSTATTSGAWQGGVDFSWYEPNSAQPEFQISTADQLAGLRYLVNNGTDFKGITINLENDIDLNSVEWIPIGTYTDAVKNDESSVFSSNETAYNGFKGTFDGNNHTIKNLYAKGSTMYNYAIGGGFKGLFGILESGSTIKNLTIENVNIQANGMVGAIAGYIPSAFDSTEPVTIENIDVIGNITIKSLFNVGGIIGRSESGSSINIKKCNVSGATGSYIRSYSSTSVAFVGGIIGAEYSSTDSIIENVSVGNLTVRGYKRAAGGIAGHILNTTVANPTIQNVKVMLDYFDEDEPENKKSIGVITGTIGAEGQTAEDIEQVGKMLTIEGTKNVSNVVLSYPYPYSEDNLPFCNGYVGTYRENTIATKNPENSIEGLPNSNEGISFEYISN